MRKHFTAANPGAGINIDIVVPAGKFWLCELLKFQFAAANAGTDRSVHIQFLTDTDQIIWRSGLAALHLINFSGAHHFHTGRPQEYTSGTGAGNRDHAMPRIVLQPGYKIQSFVLNGTGGLIDPADAFTAIRYYVDEDEKEVILIYGRAIKLNP